ncbi:MAG: protein-disulfide reductase DsbD domain-containing protein [Planctomycetota bacterium]
MLQMRGALRLVLVALGLFAAMGPAGGSDAQRGGMFDGQADVRLVSELDALVPGTSGAIGVLFSIDAGWHVYQPSQNDTGVEPSVDWAVDGSAGLSFGGFVWPAGHRFVQPGEILDHGYEGSVLLMVPVSVPAETPVGGEVTIRGEVEWLACDANRCVPGLREVSLTLPVRAEASRGGEAGLFDSARASLGRLLTGSRGEPVRVAWDGPVMEVSSAGGGRLTFVPGEGCAAVEGLLGSGVGDGALSLRFSGAAGELVVGWVRVEGAGEAAGGGGGGKSDGAAGGGASGVWLVRTVIGEAPRHVVGGAE